MQSGCKQTQKAAEELKEAIHYGEHLLSQVEEQVDRDQLLSYEVKGRLVSTKHWDEEKITKAKEGIGHYLLSCHEEVRNELKARGLKYIIVLPYMECKNEYIKRWLKRGSDIDFITKMDKRWDEMIDSCARDSATKIYLDEHEYLSDMLFI